MTTMSKDRYIKPAAFQAQQRKQRQLGKPTSTMNYTLPILMWLMTKDWLKGMEMNQRRLLRTKEWLKGMDGVAVG
jgi:hypothetical protein